MKIKINVEPEKLLDVFNDLNSKNLKVLSGTEEILNEVLTKTQKQCDFLLEEIESFNKIKTIFSK